MLALATDYGDVEILEEDLSSITEAELKKLRITRSELNRAFAQRVRLMKSRSDRVSPVAIKPLTAHGELICFATPQPVIR
jgi:hypothetical protein